jgi:uncharacterized protein YqjF (DUF2071 family)
MTVAEQDAFVEYRSKRHSTGSVSNIDAELGEGLPLPEPGSLEFFLVERYLLYAKTPRGLKTGRVHHSPYRLRSARATMVRDELVKAAGIAAGAIVHQCFCEGVDVRIYPIR